MSDDSSGEEDDDAGLALSAAWSWHAGTFDSAEESLAYHWEKHGKARGVTAQEYTSDALALWADHSKAAKPVTLRDGGPGRKIKLGPGQPTGIYTTGGAIVTFRYGGS